MEVIVGPPPECCEGSRSVRITGLLLFPDLFSHPRWRSAWRGSPAHPISSCEHCGCISGASNIWAKSPKESKAGVEWLDRAGGSRRGLDPFPSPWSQPAIPDMTTRWHHRLCGGAGAWARTVGPLRPLETTWGQGTGEWGGKWGGKWAGAGVVGAVRPGISGEDSMLSPGGLHLAPGEGCLLRLLTVLHGPQPGVFWRSGLRLWVSLRVCIVEVGGAGPGKPRGVCEGGANWPSVPQRGATRSLPCPCPSWPPYPTRPTHRRAAAPLSTSSPHVCWRDSRLPPPRPLRDPGGPWGQSGWSRGRAHTSGLTFSSQDAQLGVSLRVKESMGHGSADLDRTAECPIKGQGLEQRTLRPGAGTGLAGKTLPGRWRRTLSLHPAALNRGACGRGQERGKRPQGRGLGC